MMNSTEYAPQRGDAVWINFNPQVGHEQAGHRPAVVLPPGVYSGKTKLILIPMSILLSLKMRLIRWYTHCIIQSLKKSLL